MNPTIVTRAAKQATKHIGPNYWGVRVAQDIKMVPTWIAGMTIFLTWPTLVVYGQKKGLWNP